MRTYLSLFCCLLALAANAGAACPPDATGRAGLMALKAAQWQLPDQARQSLAVELLDCLAAPDPVLRDELAFEALSAWMRKGQLEISTLRQLRGNLLTALQSADAEGFRQPFAALGLAEVARSDRLQAFMSLDEREEVVRLGAAYLQQISDYRGFQEPDGWRHGVAHGADLMLQLALNPALSRAQQSMLLAAIASQVAPANHFYRYGEGARLMAPVFYLGKSPHFAAADWDAWFDGLASGGPAATSQASLARSHNLSAFLHALYFNLQETSDQALRQRLLPAVKRAIRQAN